MHLVLVAGGLGSRLAPLTNHIPKFLVNIGKHTGYVEQIRYWLQYQKPCEESLKSITVIVHSAYKELIEAYHALYFKNLPLTVKTVDVHNGSAHAILSTCDHLNGQAVFFQWCDVLPAETIPANDMTRRTNGTNVVFTNYDHPNRYGMVPHRESWTGLKPALQADGRGGIFGLYYISHFRTNIDFSNGQDFVEVIEKFGPVLEHRVSRIIDWGDKPKLERTRDAADEAREFNSVIFHGDLVMKSSLNEQGDALIAREIDWYRALSAVNAKVSVPSIWPADDKRSFVMSKIEGVPIFKLWPTFDDEVRALVLSRIFEQLELLHSTKRQASDLDVLHRDLRIEAYEKLVARCDEIHDVMASFGDIRKVNGYTISQNEESVLGDGLARLIDSLHANLELIYYAGEHVEVPPHYSVIHGDLQMSNSMINPDTLEITLIDPRGYFGKSTTVGLPDYDKAKLLYSLSGYDLFNYSRDLHIKKLKDGELEFDLPRPNLGGCEQLIKQHFKREHYLWLAIIWIGLAGYIKNDPVKSLCALYHGISLGKKLLELPHFDNDPSELFALL